MGIFAKIPLVEGTEPNPGQLNKNKLGELLMLLLLCVHLSVNA